MNIEELLPQRHPFLFIDEILSADCDETVGTQTYDNFFPFYQADFSGSKIVPGVILLESMVQCGGAGVTKAGIFPRASWGLASLEAVQFFDVVTYKSTVKMVVKNLKVSNKMLKQTGMAFCNDHKILEATWLCLRLPT